MSHKPDLNRRILTPPSGRPCHGASPDALLRALCDLCVAISACRLPASHRRNAHEAVREVRILLLLLDEMRHSSAPLPESALFCFSELYVVLGKLRYLLEDCAGDGARVWVLVNSGWVVSEFRSFVRSVATALDVLPLDSMDLDVEVREVVELLKRQAWKVKMDADLRDKWAKKEVLAMVEQFRTLGVPDSNRLRRVLSYLKIGSWRACNDEVKFLENELELETNKSNAQLLSSLLGLMSYSRGVIFDSINSIDGEKLNCKLNMNVIHCINLEDFKCPISLELMADPMTVATGHTYDRASIEKWLKAGNLTCPKTGERLLTTQLVPNSALRRLIHQFCREYGLSPFTNAHEPLSRSAALVSPAAAEATRMLAVYLVEKMASGSDGEKSKAAYEIRLLTKFSSFNRACLIEAGSVFWLLNLLSSSDSCIQDNSMAALLNLSKHAKGKVMMVETGGLSAIVDVLAMGHKIEARQNAAATLFYLTSIDEYRELIGEMSNAVQALVELLKSGSPRGKKNAVLAIHGLLLSHSNHDRVVAAGAIPCLLDLLPNRTSDFINDALAVLAVLAERPEGSHEIVRASGVLLLAGALKSCASRTGKEYSVSILLSLCINGGQEVIGELRKMSSITTRLYGLVADGNSRCNKKASLLLRLIRDWHGPSSPDKLTPALQRDPAVHVR